MLRILIQAGHNPPMQPGHETETGTGGEREFAARMQAVLADLFRKDGRFHVDTCPGLMPSPGWAGDVFIALHCDGGGSSARGFGFGWPGNGRDPGRGPELAHRIAKKFAAIPHPGGHHAPDNYTDGERGYYGWSRASAPSKVLIEHGFLTNSYERVWLNSHIPEMAAATYASVLDHLGLKARHVVVPKYEPPWTVWAEGKQIGRGRVDNPYVVVRISVALRAAGKKPPYKAYVDGKPIALGKFWGPTGPNSVYVKAISAQLHAGHDVDVEHVVTIKTRRV